MPLALPTDSSLRIIKAGTMFKCRDSVLKIKILDMIKEGKQFVGTVAVKTNSKDEIPSVVLNIGPNPVFFPEGGIYLPNNPIPHLVNPVKITLFNTTLWVYNIYFL